MFVPFVSVVLTGLALNAKAATFEIETCQDFVSAAEATASEGTVAIIDPTATIDCGEDYVTMQVKNNELVVRGAESTSSSTSEISLQNLRIEVFDSGILTWGPKAAFVGGDEQITLEVHGGWLNVAEGSEARFLEDVSATNFVVTSVTEDDTDFSNDQWDGGCLWNAGYFHADGFVSFEGCDSFGGGESSPGRGGTVFNAETGSILFQGGVRMEETFLTDDTGNDGAGIYNLGEVNIEGLSFFRELVADTSEASGGAIFNAEGAKFVFAQDASVAFVDTRASHGGAIFNEGDFEFGGPAWVTMCEESAIFNVGNATMKLSENSAFIGNTAEYGGGAITNLGSATIEFPDSIIFASNMHDSTVGCENVFIQEDASFWVNFDAEFTCLY